MTPIAFEQCPQFKKGEVAEKIIVEKMERSGFVVYRPQTAGAHAFDILAIKDKRQAIALDIKAKAQRTYFKDTGINVSHHRVYVEFSLSHNMPFWLVFVDEAAKLIYGNTLDELDKTREIGGRVYPMIADTRSGQIIFWHLDSMIQLGKIPDEAAQNLKDLSTRKYEYKTEGAPRV